MELYTKIELETNRRVDFGAKSARRSPPGGSARGGGSGSTWARHRGPFMCEGGGVRAQRSIRRRGGQCPARRATSRTRPQPRRVLCRPRRTVTRALAAPWPPSTDDGVHPHPTRTSLRPHWQHARTRGATLLAFIPRDGKVRKSIPRVLQLLAGLWLKEGLRTRQVLH